MTSRSPSLMLITNDTKSGSTGEMRLKALPGASSWIAYKINSIDGSEDMTEAVSFPTEWTRNPRTGAWHHPTHGEIERVGNRWRVVGTTKKFYLIGEAQKHSEERTRNRKPEQGELFG